MISIRFEYTDPSLFMPRIEYSNMVSADLADVVVRQVYWFEVFPMDLKLKL
jgi:hypothetical protein